MAPHPILDRPRGRHALREDDAPVMTVADTIVSRPGWPCETCEATVPLELAECPQCGSHFLAGASPTVNVNLPVIGNITKMSTGARVALMAGGGLLITAVFFGLLLLLGTIF